MAGILRSALFSGNDRLQKAAVSHAYHVMNGDEGDHVVRIQTFLLMVDAVSDDIAGGGQFGPPPGVSVAAFTDECGNSFYGDATEFFVMAYKNDNDIIDHSRQDTADGIVGVLTIRQMDGVMYATENLPPPLVFRQSVSSIAPPNLRTMIAAGPHTFNRYKNTKLPV